MNYGKYSLLKKKRELSSKGSMFKHMVSSWSFLIAILVIIAGIGFVGREAYKYVYDIIAEAPDIDSIDASPSGFMSTVLDASGNTTASLVASGSNRVYVTIDEMPEYLQHAFIAIEDERFYEHNGIDIKGIARAGIKDILTGKTEGASTITQQLLKNNVFDGWTEEKTKKEKITRKLQEQYLAIQLEKKVDKEWILENYMNTINLGQNTLGVQQAAKRYFGKDVSKLSLSESSVIASITKNPSKYNPITHPDYNAERRELVLTRMKDQGYISQAEFNSALADDVYSRIGEVNEAIVNSDADVTSYFVDALTEQVLKDLQEDLGYTEAVANKLLYSGGLTIYSTQDPEIQAIADEQANNTSNFEGITKVSFSYALTIKLEDESTKNYSEQTMLSWLKSNKMRDDINFSSEEDAQEMIDQYREHLLETEGGTVLGEKIFFNYQPQTAFTIIENGTGYVRAVVGGRGEKQANKTLNRATDSTRQPGSTFKIISTYSPALDQGIVTLATGVVDEPFVYSSGKVVNGGRGMITIREAIKHSVNVVALKTSREVGIATCYQSLLDYGISTLTQDDMVEALPLGGITYGVTSLEMTGAYQAIANGGLYVEPTLYTKILDNNGNVLLEKKQETRQVIKPVTAWLLTSAMQDVISGGTGSAAGFSGMAMAGKTGTTQSTRDVWFAGFTPYYTCAVWSGYDDNMVLGASRTSRNIWRETMKRVHEGLSNPGFERPEGISSATVCVDTGKYAGEMCVNTRTEYFAQGTGPQGTCEGHAKVVICKESGKLASEYCPEDCKEEIVYLLGQEDKLETPIPTELCDKHTLFSTIQDILGGEIGESNKPGQTDQPDQPTQPDQPAQPDQPTQPDTPAE